MPLPGTKVIHPGMIPALRPVAAGAQTGECTFRAPDTGRTFDQSTGQYTPTHGATLYTGPCRVQSLARRTATPLEIGDNPTTLHLYQVTIPWTAAAIGVDAVGTVTASIDDELVTRQLRVVEVAYGDLQAERHLICQLNEG